MDIEIASISKKFAKPLLENASMRVPSGTGAILTGPNGSGKSTVIKMLVSLLLPESGEILIGGQPAFRQRQRLGFCPSTSAGFYRRLSARQNLHHFASLYGLSARAVDEFIATRDIFGIDYWDTPAERLSDGMLQKVKISRAFMHDPSVVLLDEPLNYLDLRSKRAFLDWLLRWLGESPGRSYLLAQHSSELPGTLWTLRERKFEKGIA